MLMRFDPWQEMEQLLRPFNTLRMATLPLDAYRRGDTFHVEVDLPGVQPDSIDMTVERDVLELTARRVASFQEDDTVLMHERPTGDVTRQLFLGKGLDTERIEASYDNGVLSIRVPVAEEAKPHRIEVGNGSGTAKAVGAGSQESADTAA